MMKNIHANIYIYMHIYNYKMYQQHAHTEPDFHAREHETQKTLR